MDRIITNDKIEVVLTNNEPKVDEISLRELIEIILKGKNKIILTVVIFFCAGVLVSVYNYSHSKEVKSIISYNYEGVLDGKDPEGNKLDTSLIKSPAVLGEVVNNMGLKASGIDSELLRNSINIIPVIPGNIAQKIKDLEEAKKSLTTSDKEIKDFVYYPDKFEIKFNLSATNLSKARGEQVLDEIIRYYSKYFYFKYSDRDLLANIINDIDYKEYDYPEISAVINDQLQMMYSFLSKRISTKDAANFRAKCTGKSFSDIQQSIEVIDKVDVGRMDSIIEAYNLSKDKEKSIKLYEYKIKKLEVEKNKKFDESNVVLSMLDKFGSKKNIIYTEGTSDSDNYKSDLQRTKDDDSYYENLADRSVMSGVDAKNNSHDIEYYKDEIERFKDDKVSDNEKKKVEKSVIDISKNVKEKLEKWIYITNSTVNEYYEVNFNNSTIKKQAPSETDVSVKNQLTPVGIALLIGLMLGVLNTLIGEYFKKPAHA